MSSAFNKLTWSIVNLVQLITEPFLLAIARARQRFSVTIDSTPLVSIIVATYNRSEILVGRTIPSILNQTYRNIELVVVGDKCIDNTPLNVCSITDSRLRFIDLPRRGSYPKMVSDRWFVQGSVPRNFGMKIARGKWFVFLSDDDIMLPHQIEVMLSFALNNKLEFASSAYSTTKDGEHYTVYPDKNNFNSKLVCGGMQTWIYRDYLRFFKWNIHSWRKPYDKPVDYDLQQRMFRTGVRMDHISEVVSINPPVEGTNTTGYKAAILVDQLHAINSSTLD
jgi:Glycosyltransferase like family 2